MEVNKKIYLSLKLMDYFLFSICQQHGCIFFLTKLNIDEFDQISVNY